VVIAPEHPLATAAVEGGGAAEGVAEYVAAAARRSELDRTTSKEKSGVFSGLYAVHPLSGEKLPVWVADYVLAGYGTGAVMAVPAHDERDFEFAQQYALPIKQVVESGAAVVDDATGALSEAMVEHGTCVNSGDGLDGLATVEAKQEMVSRLRAKGKGDAKISFKLRDWVFSRQVSERPTVRPTERLASLSPPTTTHPPIALRPPTPFSHPTSPLFHPLSPAPSPAALLGRADPDLLPCDHGRPIGRPAQRRQAHDPV
jgi:leucyl-tRNA synthetase